jgi:glyoxylase-like metal-dependent hydrolase (beta-lactamase superfamily II)
MVTRLLSKRFVCFDILLIHFRPSIRFEFEQIDHPEEYHFPEITYADQLELVVGGVRVLLRHSKGETDDHIWVFFPDTGVLCTGDLFIWTVPNGGNPQKVQRFCKQWAQGLREMAALNPEVLCPGHGDFFVRGTGERRGDRTSSKSGF